MKIRFFLRHGAVIDWPAPGGEFSFPTMCRNIRADGYFLCQDFYIPHEVIACIGVARDGGETSAVIHQAPETKQ